MRIISHQHLLITVICHSKLNDINRKMLTVHTSFHHGQIPRSHCWILLGDAVITWIHTLLDVKNPHNIYIRNSSFLRVIVCIILYSTSESLPWARTHKESQDQRTKIQPLSKGSLKQREEHKMRNDTPPHWTGNLFTALAITLHLQRAGKVDAITADSFEESFPATWKGSESLKVFR